MTHTPTPTVSGVPMDERTKGDAYAVIRCHGDSVSGYSCGKVDLTEDQYIAQMERPNSVWACPNCGSNATFDDRAFERIHGVE